MAKLIKVTAYIDPDDLPFEFRDQNHEFGLSNAGYEALALSARLEFPDGRVSLSYLEFQQTEEDA